LSALPARLAAEFITRYGHQPRLFRAPGRVNLIGEHTDYNAGFVFPAALDLSTFVAVAPNNAGRLRAASLSLPDTLDAPVASRQTAGNWTDFITGVAALLEIQQGYDLLIATEVPLGAGLSSSAALSVATAFALGAGSLPRPAIALLCQRAENEFTPTQCGIMDPLASCLGAAGHALLIDCRDLSVRPVPIPPSVRLVIANTMAHHELAASAYNDRRATCERAAASLGVPHLRNVDYRPLDGEQLKRARHVLTENHRVLAFAAALEAGDLARAGEGMYSSHASLRDDFEVSCPELDAMVEAARPLPGVYGARMTGGGFGGCTVNLVAAEHVASVVPALRQAYLNRTGLNPDIFVCRPGPGAAEVAL
jgi:galactokinase